jgi:hypothetical protein
VRERIRLLEATGRQDEADRLRARLVLMEAGRLPWRPGPAARGS